MDFWLQRALLGCDCFLYDSRYLKHFAWACRQRGRKIPDRYHHRKPDTEAPATAKQHDRTHRVQPKD